MKTKNFLFEFEDLAWFPNTIRDCMMDCLRFMIKLTQVYQPVAPLLLEVLTITSSDRIIDLCSGSGGAMHQLQKDINRSSRTKIDILLTDKFPNCSAFQLLSEKSDGTISYLESSVDATNVPSDLKGVRTIFSAIHHFDAKSAKAIIQDAVTANAGIAIFDGGDKSIFVAMGLIPLHLIVFFFCTPFFKPFRMSRFLFTYLIPVIPFCQIWDGVVSIIRLYRPDELLQMAKEVKPEGYIWKAGKTRNRFGVHSAYLIGYPNA